MPVLLHAPAFDKQVGETYSGPAEDWLLANGYASREGYEGPGVASTGPLGTSTRNDATLAENREGADIDDETGEPEDAKIKKDRSLSNRLQSEVDDQDYVQKVAGDSDEPVLPEGDDFGSVNEADEADDLVEQIDRQFDVRAWEDDGTPVKRGERDSEDVVEGDAVSESETDSKSEGNEDATPVAQSDKNA